MTTVNDFVDILRIIREQPEWADALRSALLSKELLEMPQTLAEFAKATNRRLATLESDVAELKEGQTRLEEGQIRLEERQTRLERSLSQLEGDVGNLKGDVYEIKLGKNVDSIMGPRLGMRNVRVLKGALTGNNIAYQDLMDAAEDRGDITEEERMDLDEIDFILQGRNRLDRSTVYAALEVSVTAADSDISRAVARAGVLARATGETALPVIVSANIDDTRRQLARERNVTVITYGEDTRSSC